MNEKSLQTKNQEEREMENEKKTIYTCPMHPEVQKDQPGKCPICGMNLVPKKQEKPTPTRPTQRK